jgi:hypothetical protein
MHGKLKSDTQFESSVWLTAAEIARHLDQLITLCVRKKNQYTLQCWLEYSQIFLASNDKLRKVNVAIWVRELHTTHMKPRRLVALSIIQARVDGC